MPRSCYDEANGGSAEGEVPMDKPTAVGRETTWPVKTVPPDPRPVTTDTQTAEQAATLVIMRHGQSTWTDKKVNKFAGWVDVPLTDLGREQAAHAGDLLAEAGIAPDVLFTSLLCRSIETANIVLARVGRPWIPVRRTWRLNERHYGAFQGQTRPAMLERYGEELFTTYRRSYDVRPPEIDLDSPFYQGNDPRYSPIYADGLDDRDPRDIRAESLQDEIPRLSPFWDAYVLPELAMGHTVLVVTHGSVVRSVFMALDGISPEQIKQVNVPTGVPLVYDFATRPGGVPAVISKGRYLDPEAARLGAAEAQNLGKTQG